MTGVSLSLPADVLDELATRVAAILSTDHEVAEPWVGVTQAADHLGLARQGVYDRVHAAASTGFPVHRDGSRLIFRLSEIDAWLLERDNGHA